MEMPKTLPPNETTETQYTAITTTLWVVATLTVIFRVFCRLKLRLDLWWDDYAIIAATVFLTIDYFLGIGSYRHFLTHHIYYLNKDAVAHFFKGYFFASVTYPIQLGLIKVSLCLFYWRLFSVSLKWPIIIVGSLNFVWMVAMFFCILLQCRPIAAAWDTTITDKTCWDYRTFLIAGSAPSVITDFLVILLPIPYVLRLQTPKSYRAAICGVFLLGFLATGASIARLVSFLKQDFHNPDITWSRTPVKIWTMVELEVGAICACLPTLKPLMSFCRTGHFFPKSKGSGPPEPVAERKGSDPPNNGSRRGPRAWASVVLSGHTTRVGSVDEDERDLTDERHMGDIEMNEQSVSDVDVHERKH